ncbi:MAG: hypothetical protein QXL94_02790 [Candidatus Parvarchaeum sp.]
MFTTLFDSKMQTSTRENAVRMNDKKKKIVWLLYRLWRAKK